MKYAITLLCSLFATSAIAEEPVSLKIYPEHVGVFTTVGKQQFVAFGVMPDGTVENITAQCSWSTSNEEVATINSIGLAVTKNTHGQAKISACYPAPCGTAKPTLHTLLLQPMYSVLLDKRVSHEKPEVDIPEPVQPDEILVGKLSGSTSLTVVNVTEFISSGDVTKWEGAWPSSPSAVFPPIGQEVYLNNATFTTTKVAWESTPYTYPYQPFPNTIAAMVSAVWSVDGGKTYKLQSWDYLTNTRHDKGLEHGMPNCWMGTMVHTLCDRKPGECNGQYRSNLYFTEYPAGNKSCWGIMP